MRKRRTRTIQLDQELSFKEAAAALERKRDPMGRKLRNMVMARERQTGRQIAIRLAGEEEPKLRVTLGELYRAFPECRPARVDGLAQLARPMFERVLEQVDKRIDRRVHEYFSDECEPRIKRLEKRLEAAEQYLRTCAEGDLELTRTSTIRRNG